MNRVAIVGYGFMGKTHYGAWKKASGAKVVAVCDSNLAQLTAKTVGNVKGAADNTRLPKSVKVYDDFAKMLAAGGFDVVDITLPTPLHEKMSVAALEAGFHVICEKPMSLEPKSCDRMIAAAAKAGRQLFVGQCVRFFPEYAFLKEAVADGRFGKVVAADFTRFCPAPAWNNGGKSWFLDETKSGGAAVDMHVHDADFIQYLFGLPPAVSTHAHVRADGLTDHLTTYYHYSDKVVTADTSWAAAKALTFDAAYRVFFEKATVYCGGAYKEPVLVYPAEGKPYAPKLAKGTGYEREIRYFNDCLSGKAPERTVLTATDARNSIALVCAEKKSAATGRPVRVTFRALRSLLCAALTLAAGAALAVNDDMRSRLADTPDVPLTAEQIVALPRRPTTKTPVPEEARVYIGSGVYGNGGGMGCGGFCFTYWHPTKLSVEEQVELCAKEQVGNTLQFWQNNEKLLKLTRAAREKGIYSTCIYSKATNGLARAMAEDLGPMWLGHDFGERYNFSIYQSWDNRGATLNALVDEYMNRVHKHVNDLHKDGWGNVMATSANFSIDYEIAAGTEIPVTEDFPFGDLTLASAISRGLYRQYDLPMWGSHLAHEWYSWIPHRNPYKMKTLETAFRLKYMTGAKLIVNESGNWQLQSSLCEDSPMSKMPITCRKLSTKWNAESREKYEKPVLEEGKKRYSYIDYRSPVATKYRKAISDFYAFCKANPCPKGQPEATWAIAKGNLDLGGAGYRAGSAVCGAYDLAKKNPNWMSGLPEMSWDVVRKSVMPMPPMLAPNKNIHFSASPYGLCDVVSFACDNVTADFLLKNYKVLMFAGWNTCSEKQYKILCDYVRSGGKLVIGLCHLSTDNKREYTNLNVDQLVNKGDFTELCGLKVTGETSRKYWATGPSAEKNCLGFVARRRFGYMCLPLGKLEYVAPQENFEDLAVDDEDAEPFIVRCKNGKGEVFLMNWWAYPAAANMDVGCGAEVADIGMVGYLYQYAAKLGRGNVWITGPDFENPDEDCGWILYSYFPDEGKVYLLNLDYEHARKCVLQQFGDKDFLTLEPGEFRIVDSVKLDADEKLNQE